MHRDVISCSADSSRVWEFVDSVSDGSFLFSLVMSYTATCEITGLTVAGADASSFQYTPPADAEYLHYGRCKTINGIPMTPDGKPTPAVLTRAAVTSAAIPHVAISAGSRIVPRLPYVETGIKPGANIRMRDAMSVESARYAAECGRMVGRQLAPLTDCLVIGESIPAGTTTAMAVLRGMGFDARVSSSMPENPVRLKEDVVSDALARFEQSDTAAAACGGDDDDGMSIPSASSSITGSNFHDIAVSDDSTRLAYSTVAAVGDPMIPFVAGMVCTASVTSRVLLAGGTQMAAVLAFASSLGFDTGRVAVGTTKYVADDPCADFAKMISAVADVPAMAVDPGLDGSRHAGLRAFAQGYAKEGVGAGGCMISAMIKSGMDGRDMLQVIDSEYEALVSGAGVIT